MQQKTKAVLLISIMSVLFLVVLSTIVLLLASKYYLINVPFINKNASITTDQLEEYVENVSIRNGESAAGNQLFSASQRYFNEVEDSMYQNASYFYEYYNYSYTKSTTETIFGPKINSCNGAKIPFLFEEKIESTTYSNFDDPDNNLYMSKNIITDKNGNIINYFLDDGEYNYNYMGGTYAIREKYEDYYESSYVPETCENTQPGGVLEIPNQIEKTEPYATDETSQSYMAPDIPTNKNNEPDTFMNIDNPSQSDYPSDDIGGAPEESIEDYFDIIREEKYEGQDVWVVKTEYQELCDPNVYSLDMGRGQNFDISYENAITVTSLSWISKEDYAILHEEAYNGLTIPSNKIYERNYEYENANKSYNDVENEFVFDLNVGVKDYSYNDLPINKPNETIKRYIQNNDMIFFLPNGIFSSERWVDKSVVAQYFTEAERFDPYRDRNFYPNTPEGQQSYDNLTGDSALDCDNNICSESYFGFNTEDSGEYVLISLYAGEVKDQVISNFIENYQQSSDEVIDIYNPLENLYELDEVTKQFKGETLTFDAYELVVDDMTGSARREAHYFTEYEGMTYEIYYFGYPTLDFPSVQLLDTSVDSNVEIILQKLTPKLCSY